MDTPNGCPTSPPGNADAVDTSPHEGCDDPLQSSDRIRIAVDARRRVMKAGAGSSPVCRSLRLSCLLPPPSPPTEPQDAQDREETSDDESDSVNDVALHLSRDETPENDDLPPDEPSTILANRIIRAHDNPSPPPRDLAHINISRPPDKDGQSILHAVSVPLSPFRSINLLERLNQCSDPLFFDPTRTPRTSTSGVPPDISEPGVIPSHGSILPPSSSPFIASPPMTSTPHEGLPSSDRNPSLPARCSIGDLRLRSSQHSIASFLKPEAFNLSSTQVVDSSSNATVPSTEGDHPWTPLPRSERRQSDSKSSPLPLNTKTLISPSSNDTVQAGPGTEATTLGGQDNHAEGVPSVDNKGSNERGSKRKTTSTKELDSNTLQRWDFVSPCSTYAPAGLSLDPEPTSSVKQIILPAESICANHQSAAPPQTPTPSVVCPDFTRTSVQRPVIAPTPVRANSSLKLNSPSKSSLEVSEIYRTPAQRVPVETALTRGTSSFQRTVQLSTVLGQSRPGRSMTIKAPVFTRPALDDPSRTPAKRIPIIDLATSPTRGNETQSSPTRLGLRARSASAEPPPFGAGLARSRSIEPCATMSKPNNHGKIKEPIFPTIPTLLGTVPKLPFPLIPGQKLSSNLPPPIPEERESVEIGNTGTGTTLSRMAQGNAMSQLRQLPTSSRIPRIGNKPYARPPKNGKVVTSGATASATHALRGPPFKFACKNNGVGSSDLEVSTNDQRLMGSLKRKRGVEATVPLNSHSVMIRQVVPGMLSEKYAAKPTKFPSQVQAPSEPSPPKPPQPLKFRKVVDGMLSARYAAAKAPLPRTEPSDSQPPSPLSELSSSSDETTFDEKLSPTAHPPACPKGKVSDTPPTNVDAITVEPNAHEHFPVDQVPDSGGSSSRPRRTSRTRKPAQQQYVLDVFNANTSSRPPLARRKPPPRTGGDCFMGMSATALKALTTSNTTKNQQTVAVLATEVIRKEGLRPESPAVKARTVLQKQRDERDMRRRERAQRKAQMSEGLEGQATEGQSELDDRVSPDAPVDHDENDDVMLQKHRRGPGDEEDYETPERPQRLIEPLNLEGMDRKVNPAKQVKWHRGLSTAVCLDEVDPKPKSLPKNDIVRGCLAPTSKNLPLDSLGNLIDRENRPSPELITEHIVVKKYLYDNDIEPEPIPAKMTRSKSKKSKS